MSKPFRELVNKLSPEAKQKAKEKAVAMLAEMPLQELRRARHLSQERLAELLHTKQSNLSRLEKRTDMYISTLRSYIEAMGGELDIVARFPEGEIHLTQFHLLEDKNNSSAIFSANRGKEA